MINTRLTNTPIGDNDLIALQHNLLKKLLNLNQDANMNSGLSTDENEDGYIWKVIIFDKFCSTVLSTLFKIGSLWSENVTLHLNLISAREKLHGIKVVYFVQPTDENITKIIEDFSKDLYDSVYINFAYPIESEKLQKMAKSLSKYYCTHKIKQVYQHYMNYISLTPTLFETNLPNVYSILNSVGETKEKSLYYDQIALTLLSVIKTFQTLPIIYYTKLHGEEVVKRLENLIVTYIGDQGKNEEKMFTNQMTLILLPRNLDHGVLFLHPWHYGALISDVLGIKFNKVELNNAITDNKKTEYDLDPKIDSFWAEKMNVPFPHVAEDIDRELNKWKSEYEAMDHKKLSKDVEDISSNLSSALDKVPQMTERKKRIDMHTNIATHLFNEIKSRSLDQFYEAESSLLFGQKLDKNIFYQLLESPKMDSQDFVFDKIRLISIYFLTNETVNQKDLERIDLVMNKLVDKVDPKILEYLKKRKASGADFTEKVEIESEESKTKGSNGRTLFKSLSKVYESSKVLLQNVPNILPGNEKNFIFTKHVANILQNKNINDLKDFSQLNLASRIKHQELEKKNDCIVFGIDGGCYNEYQNLQEWAKKQNINLFYGASYLYSAKEFLKNCGF